MIRKEALLVDDTVNALCPSCKEMQSHSVIEVTDQKTRVQCSACQSICNVRAKKAKAPSKSVRKGAPTSRRAQAEQATRDREEWAALRPGMMVEKAIPYRMTDIFRVRDLMRHPSFGLGLVTRQAGPHKIEVLFEGGKKLLCCQ